MGNHSNKDSPGGADHPAASAAEAESWYREITRLSAERRQLPAWASDETGQVAEERRRIDVVLGHALASYSRVWQFGPVRKERCDCCGLYTLDGKDAHEICGVCWWEDDPVQAEDADFQGGPNHGLSLNEARKAFQQRGISGPPHDLWKGAVARRLGERDRIRPLFEMVMDEITRTVRADLGERASRETIRAETLRRMRTYWTSPAGRKRKAEYDRHRPPMQPLKRDAG
ncbi:MAG TPA: CPCC family cysteine-rich protein [Chloroflexota bacterium]|nr:CPCC family cysteine-rich protein [Chloroflexota bacterium]